MGSSRLNRYMVRVNNYLRLGGGYHGWSVNSTRSIKCGQYNHDSTDIDRRRFKPVRGPNRIDIGGCFLGACQLEERDCAAISTWNEFEHWPFWLVGPFALESAREVVPLFVAGNQVSV